MNEKIIINYYKQNKVLKLFEKVFETFPVCRKCHKVKDWLMYIP